MAGRTPAARGKLAKGKDLAVGGLSYSIEKVKSVFRKRRNLLGMVTSKGIIRVTFSYRRPEKSGVLLVAVSERGREVLPDSQEAYRTDRATWPQAVPRSVHIPMDIDDVDHFLIKTRKVHWATFAGFATSPAPTTRPASGAPE